VIFHPFFAGFGEGFYHGRTEAERDPALIVLATLSVAAIFMGHENGFARAELCGFIWCPHWSSSHAWEKIAYDLGLNSLFFTFW
jgi:hypothetical protein